MPREVGRTDNDVGHRTTAGKSGADTHEKAADNAFPELSRSHRVFAPLFLNDRSGKRTDEHAQNQIRTPVEIALLVELNELKQVADRNRKAKTEVASRIGTEIPSGNADNAQGDAGRNACPVVGILFIRAYPFDNGVNRKNKEKGNEPKRRNIQRIGNS